jgi:hypothetical protein
MGIRNSLMIFAFTCLCLTNGCDKSIARTADDVAATYQESVANHKSDVDTSLVLGTWHMSIGMMPVFMSIWPDHAAATMNGVSVSTAIRLIDSNSFEILESRCNTVTWYNQWSRTCLCKGIFKIPSESFYGEGFIWTGNSNPCEVPKGARKVMLKTVKIKTYDEMLAFFKASDAQ